MIVDGIRAHCEKCDTAPDQVIQDDEAGKVTSCACGAYKLLDFRDRKEVIREALERAPANTFTDSLRRQFEERGDLSVKQYEALMRAVK
jgi:hypothetical protein